MITEIITSVLSGGATGLLGAGMQLWAKAGERKHELEVLKLNMQNTETLRKLEMEAEERRAQRTAESAERVAAYDAEARAIEQQSADYQASLGADKATYLAPSAQEGAGTSAAVARVLMAVVDFLRGIIRPGATIYSLVLISLLLHHVLGLWARAGSPITEATANDLATEVVKTVLYVATTVLFWWFGVRPAGKK